VLLWQNHGYQEIRDSMDGAAVPQIGTDTTARDYRKLAEGFGCHAVRVDTIDAIPTAIASALAADAPTIIELDAPSLL
jgi:thiamine pyrophosphate-dependent acetolactate synthase large subunit-like protein